MDMLTYLIPISLGFCIVMQGGINQKASAKFGLPLVVLINMLIALLLSLVYYLGTEKTKLQELTHGYHWSYLIPGICGFLIVLGVPYSISKIGALKTFLIVIVAQTLLSVIWDVYSLGIPFSGMKVMGMFLSLIGITLLTLS